MLFAALWSCRSEPTPFDGEVPAEPAPAERPAGELPAGELPPEVAASYELSFPERDRHRVSVVMTFRCPGSGATELWMPTWTPGSYLVREYARTVDRVDVEGGSARKSAKNRWAVTCAADQPTVARYTVYGWPGSVRETFVDAELAVLNGAATFLIPRGAAGPDAAGTSGAAGTSAEAAAGTSAAAGSSAAPGTSAGAAAGTSTGAAAANSAGAAAGTSTGAAAANSAGAPAGTSTRAAAGASGGVASEPAGGAASGTAGGAAGAAAGTSGAVAARSSGAAPGRFEIRIERPEGWDTVLSPLGSSDRLVAADLDTLIDAPILVGDVVVEPFEVRGVPHALGVVGRAATFDPAEAARTAAAVGEELAGIWGRVPYPRYDVLVWLQDQGGGGLEHATSTLVTASRWSDEAERKRFAALVAHEMAHAWNGKRLRPRGLGPFDYEAEVYTPSLWVVEGVTSYLSLLAVARAELRTEEETLEALSRVVSAVQTAPGRSDESLSTSSLDAWVGEYRRDADSPNRDVSYYHKGEVVAFLLDAAIRRATDDRRSLDDWLRLAFERFGDRPYEEAELRALASEVAGEDLGPFFAAAVDGTDELDYGSALQWFGLGWTDPGPEKAWLGAKVDERGVVTEVRDGTPAAAAGLSVDDEVLALGGFRVGGDTLTERVEQLGPGWTGEVLVARGGVVRALPLTLGTRPERTWTLQVDPGASPLAHRRRTRWLGGE